MVAQDINSCTLVDCSKEKGNCLKVRGCPYKTVHTKLPKIDPHPLVRKMFALAQSSSRLSPTPRPCGHYKFRKIRSFFLQQKVRTSAFEEHPISVKSSALYKPLPPDCGRLLWAAPKA